MIPSDGDSQDKKIAVQFLGFPKQLRPEPVELLLGKGQVIKVRTPGHELSETYRIPAVDTLIVEETVLDDEGEPVFKEYGRARALATPKQIVLLLRKGEEPSDGFVVLPISGELNDFKGGSYYFINASSLNMGVEIGDKKFALKPSQRKNVKPKPDHEADVCQTTFSYQKEDKWKRFHDTRWSTNELYRTLVFFYQDAKTNRIEVAPIIDMMVE